MQVFYKCPVYLYIVNIHLSQIYKRCKANAKIIQGEFAAHGFKLSYKFGSLIYVPHRGSFCYLKYQVLRPCPCLNYLRADKGHKVFVSQILSRKVHAEDFMAFIRSKIIETGA